MTKNMSYLLIIGVVFALGVGAGMLTGTGTSKQSDSDAQQISALNNMLRQKDIEIAELNEKIAGLAESAKQINPDQPDVNPDNSQLQDRQAADAMADEQVTIEIATLETTETLNELQRMTDSPNLFNDELADTLQQRLYTKLDTDPMATRQVLDAFIRSPDSEMGQMLSSVLGLFKDAEIESAAMQLAGSGINADQRIAGLSLLRRLDIDNQASRQVVVKIIDTETDPEVVNAALYALKPTVASKQEAQKVLHALQRHLSSDDPETRRRSVIAYADWATGASNTQAIVNALYDDSVDVRAGAAFALSRSKHRSESIRDALIAKISDGNEDWTVRDQAWQAVQSFELDDESRRVFLEFKKQREQNSEGGSG